MTAQRILPFLTALFMFFALTAVSHATLIDNGDGTVTQIRIDGSRLMWLQDANTPRTSGYASDHGYDADGYMFWADANTWIDYLNSSNYKGYNDWRLPATGPVNGSTYNYSWPSYDGSSDLGYNMSAPGTAYAGSTGSEMAYLYYYELGNLAYYDTAGSGPQAGWGLTNTGLFTNLEHNTRYWSSTEHALLPNYAWDFWFGYGQQSYITSAYLNAWAVRDVGTVPEPTSLLLLGSGLVGIISLQRKKH